MFTNQFRLAGSVGSDRHVEEEDTLKTKKALHQLGRYDIPEYGLTPYPDEQMFQEIGKFQKEKKLYQDRIMNPNGETEAAINRELSKFKRNPYVRPMSMQSGENDSDLETEIAEKEQECAEIESDAQTAERNRQDVQNSGDRKSMKYWAKEYEKLIRDSSVCTSQRPGYQLNNRMPKFPNPTPR